MTDDNYDIEKEREELIKMMGDSIDPQIMQAIEIANNAVGSSQEAVEIIISSEGPINA